jgi:hypothetical protein
MKEQWLKPYPFQLRMALLVCVCKEFPTRERNGNSYNALYGD